MRIIDILKLDSTQRKNKYKAVGIDFVKINEYTFTDYKAFSFLLEKSYIKSPERSSDGSISNLNSYPFFVTPHLKIDFSLLSINSYRDLMGLIYTQNEFTVECYNIVSNRVETHKMYFATEEMPKLWTIARAVNGEQWVELLGVEDYTIEMIGTNASLDKIDILYYDNDGNLIPEATQTVIEGTDVVINYNFIAPSGSRFDGVWRMQSGGIVRNGDAILAIGTDESSGNAIVSNKVLKLYAKVVNTNQYTISLNYGIGEKPLLQDTTKNVDTFDIVVGQRIGIAISNANVVLADGSTFAFPTYGTGAPTVTYNGKEYDNAYDFLGWSWDVSSTESALQVNSSTTYDYSFNRTIYQHYEPKTYTITYDTKVDSLSLSPVSAKHGERITTPTLRNGNKVSKGWFWFDGVKEVQFNGVMPPFHMTIYTKWD